MIENDDALSPKAAYFKVIELLSRREHSVLELTRKLHRKNFSDDVIQSAIKKAQQNGYQSNQRFAESYTRMRFNNGFGLIRIVGELIQRGVDTELAEDVVNHTEIDWSAQCELVFQKKFAKCLPTNFNERAKCARYLQYRGFAQDSISHCLAKHNIQ